MAGLGSGGNVLAALCSFFIPGLGQLLQGRLAMALIHFVLAGILWFFLPGGSFTSGQLSMPHDIPHHSSQRHNVFRTSY
jgi:hypothetical protein